MCEWVSGITCRGGKIEVRPTDSSHEEIAKRLKLRDHGLSESGKWEYVPPATWRPKKKGLFDGWKFSIADPPSWWEPEHETAAIHAAQAAVRTICVSSGAHKVGPGERLYAWGKAVITEVTGGEARACGNATIQSVTGGVAKAYDNATIQSVTGGEARAYGNATIQSVTGGEAYAYDNAKILKDTRK